MYVLIVVLGIIIFSHSLLFMFIIQKNTDLMNKIVQLEKRIIPLKNPAQRPFSPIKKTTKFVQFSNDRKGKSVKRGSW